ncbi:MAG: DUF6807 family protein [Gemmataceae bacterium]
MRRLLFGSLAALLLAASSALSASSVEFTVAAGKQARHNEPVCVPLQLPAGTEVDAVVSVVDADGKTIAIGQVTGPGLRTESIKAKSGMVRKDLHFVLPELAAGKSLTLRATVSGGKFGGAGTTFHWTHDKDDGWSDLGHGNRPVLRYIHAKLDESSKAARERTFKVFHHVYSPDGKQLLTNGPMPGESYGQGIQFPHHRGLFYGFMKCTYDKNTVDIWHCTKDTHQAHRKTEEEIGGPILGRHRVVIDWNGVGKKPFAVERREVTVYAVPDGTLIEFNSQLTPTGSPVKLDGDPQHAGFHFRASNEVAAKTSKETIYIRPDGVDKPGATRNWDGKGNKTHVNLPWLGMSFVVDGQRYTAAYLDCPSNPKEARFSERNYGRFGSYFVTTVKKEKPLLVEYRVWLQPGQMKPAEIAALDRAFVEPVKVTVK